MSVVYEARNFIHDGSYPPIGDHDHGADADRFADPTDAVVNDLASAAGAYHATAQMLADADAEADADARMDGLPSSPMKEDSPASTTQQRTKSVPKPDREVTKNTEGKFICNWPNCTEDVKEFQRKCEWNKHMDKHDRPYKCTAEGCEKLPGFTYSGGLLRHEREVHGKHGGPKNLFTCPHPNCKRHWGKGFSRQENLNEHLRRVHTQSDMAAGTNGAGVGVGADDSDDVASHAGSTSAGGGGPPSGLKRKRVTDQDEQELRDELRRVRQENDELRRQVENQNHQTVALVQQVAQLQEALGAMRAPTAQMM